MKKREQGMADKVTIIIGIALSLVMIGFFRPDGIMNKVNFRSAMMLPCGLTYNGIADNDKITFPMQLTGYINGCGWERNGMIAGTAQVFDAKGFPVTVATPLDITDRNGAMLPLPFLVTLHPNFGPQADHGQLVIISNSGLVQMVPVNF